MIATSIFLLNMQHLTELPKSDNIACLKNLMNVKVDNDLLQLDVIGARSKNFDQIIIREKN
jgi:hypothetical protein